MFSSLTLSLAYATIYATYQKNTDTLSLSLQSSRSETDLFPKHYAYFPMILIEKRVDFFEEFVFDAASLFLFISIFFQMHL